MRFIMSGTENVETQDKPTIEGEAQDVTKQEGATTPPATGAEDGAQEKKEKPWFQKRIDEVTKDKWDAIREAEAAKTRAAELEKALQELKSGGDKDAKKTDPGSGDDIEKLAERL